MIEFRDINIEGYGSIVKPLEFKLDRPGLSILRGRVGSGKTTIPSALTWALFGKSLKNKASVETWKEIRPESYRGTAVGVRFIKDEVEYVITRCQSFKGKVGKVKGNSNLFIFVDGESYTEVKNKKEQQAFIQETLGYSFDLFKSSIVFGQKVKRIIEESGPDKKKIFEEGFNVGFIEEAKLKEKEELTKLHTGHSTLDQSMEKTYDKIQDAHESWEDALETEKNFEDERQARIKELEKSNKQDNKYITEVKEQKVPTKKSVKRLENKLGSLRAKLGLIAIQEANKISWETKVSADTKVLSAFQHSLDNLDDKCETCGRKATPKSLAVTKETLKRDLKFTEKLILENERKIIGIKIPDKSKLEARILKLDKQKTNLTGLIAGQKVKLKLIPELNKKISKRDKKITALAEKKLKLHSIKYKKKKTKLEKKLSTLKTDISLIQEEIDLKEWLIKDPLSNKGLKVYMFDSLLQRVNEKLSEYSQTLGFLVEFGIDLDSHQKDFYQYILMDEIVIPYEDLSGGQKQLVDTSVAFAIHDVITDLRPMNILFLDEPFESLGVEDIETIEELVTNKAKDTCTYVITHQENFNPTNCNTLSFTLSKKKFTKIL